MGYLKFFAILIIALSILIIPSSAVVVGTVVDRGSTIFIGEKYLDISNSMNVSGTQRHVIGYWLPGANIQTTSPTDTMDVGDGKQFEVAIGMRTGSWYSLNNMGVDPVAAFTVAEPRISIIIRSNETNVNGKTATTDSVLTFEINSNLNQLSNNRYRDSNKTPINQTTDGYMTIKIISPTGATYNNIVGTSGRISTENIFPSNNPFRWSGNWKVGAVDTNGQKIYPAGIYSVTVECTLNGMNTNYDVVGKTISEPATVTIGSTSVSITIDKESVMRNKPFAVTITGKPNAYYNLWVKDTSKMTSSTETPPKITLYQEGVDTNNNLTANYAFQNSNGKTIGQDVPSTGGPYYARVLTSSDGTRIVQFDTGPNTKAQKYTIRVEENISSQYKYDEVTIIIGGGKMTIVSQGYQNYYIGEVIKFSGTNTESYETYLFVTGPNLPTNGAQIDSLDPRNNPVVNGDPNTFHREFVDSGTWNWDMSTANLALDAGTYTVYAVANASDRLHLGGTAYATTSITLVKPFVSAAVSQPVVAKGDDLFISGKAEGNPSDGVAVWIMGKNFMRYETVSITSGSEFKYELDGGITADMASGQYFVVVQHPMQNGRFDIVIEGDYVSNLQLNAANSTSTGLSIFKISGSGSLQGSDAAEALIEAIDDQNIDDTYTKLQFIVEQPVIMLDAVGDKRIGDKFTVTGRTNLAVDDEVQIDIYSSSFKPTEKSTSGEFSGASGTVKVVKTDATDGMNRIQFQVDSSTFREDEYIIVAHGVEVDASSSALFNVMGTSLTFNQTQSNVNMTSPITTPPTPIPTTIIPTPTATPTKQSPGYGAILACVGLGIISFIIIRRNNN